MRISRGKLGLADLILTVLNLRKRTLAGLIERELSEETREFLESLFVQPAADTQGGDATRSRYRLTLLKSQSQSTRPAKIKERVADHQFLHALHERLAPLLGVEPTLVLPAAISTLPATALP